MPADFSEPVLHDRAPIVFLKLGSIDAATLGFLVKVDLFQPVGASANLFKNALRVVRVDCRIGTATEDDLPTIDSRRAELPDFINCISLHCSERGRHIARGPIRHSWVDAYCVEDIGIG